MWAPPMLTKGGGGTKQRFVIPVLIVFIIVIIIIFNSTPLQETLFWLGSVGKKYQGKEGGDIKDL